MSLDGRGRERERAVARRVDAAPPLAGEGRRGRAQLVDARTQPVPLPPAAAFAPIVRIGGAQGWYAGQTLQRLRGWIDVVVGGPGMRRGRRDPMALQIGDAIDCWRVEAFEPDRLLRLRAEMRMPGRAWLQFEVEPAATGSTVRQTAVFDPTGVLGLAYWYGLRPFHGSIFGRMLCRIGRVAAAMADDGSGSVGAASCRH